MKNLLLTLLLLSFSSSFAQEDPLEVQVGEKIFNDDRFSFLFFKNFNSAFNAHLPIGDQSLDRLITLMGETDHPMRGRHMSCAACHFVDQASKVGVVNYNDFASRSPIPTREDGEHFTLRHSQNMVASGLRSGTPLHWDGEFWSTKDLAKASLVGRNMGWLIEEAPLARAHAAQVILNDDGSYMGKDFTQGSYQELFKNLGVDPSFMPAEKIFDQIAQFLSDYMHSLDFQRDMSGNFSGSAFDQFVKANGLPTQAQALIEATQKNRDWKWISDMPLKYHSEPARFGELELEGWRIFSGKAQCVRCHTPPEFTDHLFHNIGISELEYQRKHTTFFRDLFIPTAIERRQSPEKYLIATEAHPKWLGPFRKAPNPNDPNALDLGMWNLFEHPDYPHLQENLKTALCAALDEERSQNYRSCLNSSSDELLPLTVARFKTPSLRNLGQSAPYFHDGSVPNLQNTLVVYMAMSNLTRRGRLVNPAPQLKDMRLESRDFTALTAFLRSLNEDYD